MLLKLYTYTYISIHNMQRLFAPGRRDNLHVCNVRAGAEYRIAKHTRSYTGDHRNIADDHAIEFQTLKLTDDYCVVARRDMVF